MREYLAKLGFRTVEEAIGRSELIDSGEAVDNWKAQGIDLAPLFTMPKVPEGASTDRRQTKAQDHGLDKALDRTPIVDLAVADLVLRLADPAGARGGSASGSSRPR